MSKVVYTIRNVIDDSVYVGQTSDIDGRWAKHLFNGTHPLYVAMAKVGADNFYVDTVIPVDDGQVDQAERHAIEGLLRAGVPVLNRYCLHDDGVMRSVATQRRPRKTRRGEKIGKLLWCPSKGAFVGKFFSRSRKVHKKCVPKAITDQAEAQKWFEDWFYARRG